MRNIILVSCILLHFSIKADAQDIDFKGKGDNFSKVFNYYEKQFKDVIVYLIPERGSLVHFRIMGKKKTRWHLIDHYIHESNFYRQYKLDSATIKFINEIAKDSLASRKCSNCKEIFQLIEENDLAHLKSEDQLSTPCKKIIYDILNGDTMTRLNKSLEQIQHISTHILGYKLNNKKGRISYRDPAEAMKICPEIPEWRRFDNIIIALKMAY